MAATVAVTAATVVTPVMSLKNLHQEQQQQQQHHHHHYQQKRNLGFLAEINQNRMTEKKQQLQNEITTFGETKTKSRKVGQYEYGYFDQLRGINGVALENGATVVKVSLPAENGTDGSEDNVFVESADKFILRELASFLGFTVGGSSQLWIDCAGGAILALHHFNNGISDVIPEISESATKCPTLKFTMEFFDTHFSPIRASRHLADDLLPRRTRRDPTRPFPTALVGAIRSAVSSPIATLAGVSSIPQISHASTSAAFDNKGNFPYFARTVPSSVGDATAAVDFLVSRLGVTHFGVLHVRDTYGSTYAQAVVDAARQANATIVKSSFEFGLLTEEDAKKAVRPLKESGYRYFIGIFFVLDFEVVMAQCVKDGVAGPGNFWLFSDSMAGIFGTTKFPSDSPLVQAAYGSALINLPSPEVRVGQRGHDAFMNYWPLLKNNDTIRSYFNSKMPQNVQEEDDGAYLENFEFSDLPSAYPFVFYDSVIALALASCNAQVKYGINFTGPQLYESILTTDIDASFGRVKLNPITGSRDYRTVPYTVSNIVPKPTNDQDIGFESFQEVVTEQYNLAPNDPSIALWDAVPGSNPFIYADGTTVPPNALPPLVVSIDKVHAEGMIVGAALCTISFLLSIGFATWTHCNVETRVIRASQPIFLGMLCSGTLIMSLAIIPMSLQEPIHPTILNISCMSVPWMLSIGFVLAFAALFSKMKRINTIFRTRRFNRVKVQAKDVMIPFLGLMTFNVAVLISWTITTPLTYRREYILGAVDSFGRPNRAFLTCLPSEPSAFDISFLVVWLLSNFLAMIYANIEAYRGRNINIEYSESRYIALSMASITQGFLIGFPLILVTRDSPNSSHVVMSCLIFITCIAVLLPMFVPKMLHVQQWKRQQIERDKKRALKHERRKQFDAMLRGERPHVSIIMVDDGSQPTTGTMDDLSVVSASGGRNGLRIVDPMQEETAETSRTRSNLSRLKKENLILKAASRNLKTEIDLVKQSSRQLDTKSYSERSSLRSSSLLLRDSVAVVQAVTTTTKTTTNEARKSIFGIEALGEDVEEVDEEEVSDYSDGDDDVLSNSSLDDFKDDYESRQPPPLLPQRVFPRIAAVQALSKKRIQSDENEAKNGQ